MFRINASVMPQKIINIFKMSQDYHYTQLKLKQFPNILKWTYTRVDVFDNIQIFNQHSMQAEKMAAFWIQSSNFAASLLKETHLCNIDSVIKLYE